MKRLFRLSVYLMLIWGGNSSEAQTAHHAVVPVKDITKGLMDFLYYQRDHLRFNEDFVSYDEKGIKIKNGEFLQKIKLGSYLPVQVQSKNNLWEYQLYKVNKGMDPDIISTLKDIGETYYQFYSIKGRSFPKFRFVDLNRHTYTPESTKGKIIILKAWFTACLPCVQEMPALNRLTEKLKNRQDIIFLSLAFDKKQALQNFMKYHQFNYAVIPVNKSYLEDTLQITRYPAHWIINKKGIVVHMSYNMTEMVSALDKELAR
jgi:peroxiredoxin